MSSKKSIKNNLKPNIKGKRKINIKTEVNNEKLLNDTPQKNKSSRILKNLESALSPKYIQITVNNDGLKRSRYGREQKYKENEGFLPTEAVYQRHITSKSPKSAVKVNSNLIKIQPLCKSAPDRYFDSPIQRLIVKNRELASIEKNTPIIKDDIFKNDIVKIKRTLFDNNNSFHLDEDLTSPKPSTIDNISNNSITLDNSINLNNSNTVIKEVEPNEKEIEKPEINEKEIEKPEINEKEIEEAEVNEIEIEEVEANEKEIEEVIITEKSENKIEIKEEEIIFPVKPEIENVEAKINTMLTNSMEYVVGDLCWARIGNYPYWPSIIYPDDKGKHYVIHGNQKKYHIKFFADNGRRCWVNTITTLPFNGLKDFISKKMEIEEVLDLAKVNITKRKKLFKPFTVSNPRQEVWNSAVDEASRILPVSQEERIKEFDNLIEEIKKQKKEKNDEYKRIRKLINLEKRLRSPTPESPAYEPIIPVKRKKLNDSNEIALLLKQSDPLKSNFETFDELSDNPIDSYLIDNFAESLGKNEAMSYLLDDDSKYILNEENNYIPYTPLINNPTNFYNNFRENFLKNDTDNINENQLREFSDKLIVLKKFLNKNNEMENSIMELPLDEIKLENSLMPENIDIKTETQSVLSLMITETPSSSSSSLGSPISTTTNNSTNMAEFSKNYLFKKLTREFTCRLCFKPSNLLKCEGPCHGWYHRNCVINQKKLSDNDRDKILKEFKCSDCVVKQKPACFVCKEYTDEPYLRIRCKFNACGRYYHDGCLKYFPQAKKNGVESLICPSHSCHTCVSDDPRGKYLTNDRSSLVKCVKCPSTYHIDSTCIPAGTQFITAVQIICPKHRSKSTKQLNANWCFICTEGGRLVCCETCPTAFHYECLKINIPEEKGYICEECETGRLPLYGEIVWAKLGCFRWWPGQIIPPPAIPDNILRLYRNPYDFCVKFFGTNNFAWLNRSRVYLYHEGDWGKARNKSSREKRYEQALTEAKELYDKLVVEKNLRKIEGKEKLIPMPYVKIKSNKIVPPVKLIESDKNDLLPCECKSNDIEPCGPNSGCINRLLLIECHPAVCLAKENCLNQMFQRRIYPRLKVSHTENRGWGLIVLENIKIGSFVVEYVGEIIDNNEFKKRLEKKKLEKDENYYFLTLTNNLLIDAGPKGNVARFINHSCEPNCETQKWNVNGITRIGLFAKFDIPANTELTFNYNLDCLGEDKKICHCGAKKCSGFIGVKYKQVPSKPVTSGVNKKFKTKHPKRKKNPKLKTTNNNNNNNNNKISTNNPSDSSNNQFSNNETTKELEISKTDIKI